MTSARGGARRQPSKASTEERVRTMLASKPGGLYSNHDVVGTGASASARMSRFAAQDRRWPAVHRRTPSLVVLFVEHCQGWLPTSNSGL